MKPKETHKNTINHKKKGPIFTYTEKETRFMTTLLKNTNINIDFHTNTIKHHLWPQQQNTNDYNEANYIN